MGRGYQPTQLLCAADSRCCATQEREPSQCLRNTTIEGLVHRRNISRSDATPWNGVSIERWLRRSIPRAKNPARKGLPHRLRQSARPHSEVVDEHRLVNGWPVADVRRDYELIELERRVCA